MRRQQLLVQLLENGRNSWLSISLGLGLHARSHLVEYQWSWERWGISLELHGRTWSMTWRELGPRSQRLPLVTHYTVIWIKILGVEWGWKHHALGVLFSKVDRTTAPYGGEDGWGHVSGHFGQQPPSLSMSIEAGSSSMTMTPTIQQGQIRSGSVRSISRSWSGLASLQTWTQ